MVAPQQMQQSQPQPGDAFGRLVMQITQATGAPPEIVAGFLQHMAQTLVPQIGPQRFVEQMRQILSQPPQVLVGLLQEFANSPAGAALGHAGGPPGNAVPPPGMGPGSPPPLAGGGAPPGAISSPPPSPSPIGGPPNQAGGPPSLPGQPQPQQPKPKPKKQPRKDRADAWEPEELPEARYKDGPGYKTVIAHAEEARRFYDALDSALQGWRDIWHMVEDKTKLDRTLADDGAGSDVVHTRAQPTTMALRIIGMTAPSLTRIGLQADPWDDTDECREAAQKNENFARYALEQAERLWNRRATVGDYRPPFDRTLSGLATIEGGYGFRVMPNPGRKSFPWDVEPVPILELKPRPLATTRQVECSLSEAYAYEQVRTLLPPAREGETDPPYSDETRTRLTTWTDETHYCMVAEFVSPEIQKKAKERSNQDWWIVPPTEHKLGRRIYIIPNPWNSDPLGPSSRDTTDRARYLVQGIYWNIEGTIKFTNKMVSALGTDVFKNIHRPKKWKLNTALRATGAASGLPAIDYDQAHIPGGNVVLDISEDVGDIIEDLASTPSGQAFLQSLLGDMGDIAPPVMGGRGAVESGFDRFQASQAAGVLHVDPIIAYHCRSLEYLIETILTDFVRLGEGEEKIFNKVPYRTYKVKRGSTGKAGYMSALTAKDVRKNGPFVSVRFTDDNLTMQMQLTQLMLLQVKEHLRSRVSAMDELGIDDTERERLLMFTEAALEAPDVVKAAIKTALAAQAAEHEVEPDGTVNEAALFLAALEDLEAKQAMGGGGMGGPEKGMPGMPSPAGAAPPPMPGSSAGPPAVMGGA